MIRSGEFVLLIGGTGKTGFHIANFLIERRVPVRIVVRNKSTVTQLFGLKQVAFESIRQCEDFTNTKGKEQLRKAFEPSDVYGPITHVVSALGANSKSKHNVEKIQYQTQKILIDLSKELNIKKYLLLSAALITRAWNPVSLFLNMILSNVYAHKAKAENYLRKSDLNYTIVRPGGLKGGYEDSKPTAYTVQQGDKGRSGTITRSTVALLVVDSLLSEDIKNKVTFECFSTPQQLKQDYQLPAQRLSELHEDTEADIVTANHAKSTSVVKFVVFASVVFGVSRLAMLLK